MYSVRVSRQGEFLYDLDFDRPQLIVGRSQESDVALPHGTVSRRHACIYQRDGRLYVVDLGSSNGTYVNGRPVHGELLLNRGDVVYCGIFSLEPFPRSAQSRSEPVVPTTVQTPASPPSSYAASSDSRPDPHAGSQPRVSSTEKTIAPGSLNLADLHAEMARRRLGGSAAPDAVTDPGPPPRHDRDDDRARQSFREREREGDRERKREREYRERELRGRERERELERERARESSAPRPDPRRATPDDPTYPAAQPPERPRSSPPERPRSSPPPERPSTAPPPPSWSRGPGVPPPPIPPPTFGDMVGPSVMRGPSDD